MDISPIRLTRNTFSESLAGAMFAGMAPWNVRGDRMTRLSDCLRGGLGILRVGCARCDRRGAYDVRRAIERYGDPNLRAFEKLAGIGADCPNAHATLDAHRCSIHFRDLMLLNAPLCSCADKERRQRNALEAASLNLRDRAAKKVAR